MITKGKILAIDLTGNTCQVRMPVFETAGSDEISATATFSNTPGIYNGYQVGDVVYVAFENGTMDTPVVIGKLFLGNLAEEKSPRGTVNVETSTVTKKATLPFDSKLDTTVGKDNKLPNTSAPFSSLASLAGKVNELDTATMQIKAHIDANDALDIEGPVLNPVSNTTTGYRFIMLACEKPGNDGTVVIDLNALLTSNSRINELWCPLCWQKGTTTFKVPTITIDYATGVATAAIPTTGNSTTYYCFTAVASVYYRS